MNREENDLRARRLAAGLSQEDLASLAAVSPTTIRNAETGRVSQPRLGQRIEDALARYMSGPGHDLPPSSLIYVTANGSHHLVDADQWDPANLAPRELAVCRALLQHALAKLDAADPAVPAPPWPPMHPETRT